jgi:hypothetical protein
MANGDRLFSVDPKSGPPKRSAPMGTRPHTKTIGDRTEAMVMARLLQVYSVVLLPFGENCRYDLLIEDGERFVRVQCKTGRLRDGAVWFPSCSTSYLTRADGAKPRRRSCVDAADVFGIYCPETDAVYLVPVNEVGSRSGSLRVDPPRNNQTKKVRWATDYELEMPG